MVGECLHNISLLNGQVVSATTDGFITDLKDLENQILNDPRIKSNVLLKAYRAIRFELSNDYSGLEVKFEGKGIISWTTRGQLGVGSKIKATTGFQTQRITQPELVTKFLDIMQGNAKILEYSSTRLRGAKDLYKKGGHVTMIVRDQIFRLAYDNRRRIIEVPYSNVYRGKLQLEAEELSTKLKELGSFYDSDYNLIVKETNNESVENNKSEYEKIVEAHKKLNDEIFSLSDECNAPLLDSEPLKNASECLHLRFISRFHRSSSYNKNTSKTMSSTYKNAMDRAVRSFIKGALAEEPQFGLKKDSFLRYNDIISFITGFDSKIKTSKQSISNLKRRKALNKAVPRTEETLNFAQYVKEQFPDFDESLFFERL